MFARLKKFAHIALLGLAGQGIAANVVVAHDYAPAGYRYETRVSYETREESYSVRETRYDSHGNRSYVTITRYRTVRVPGYQRVLVRAYGS
jgi:hypothetical protein